jgi:hypothetical protein
MAIVLPNGRNYFATSTGAPLVGGKVYAYVAGTSTPKDTYTTSAASVANTHPVVLDSRGEAAIYWDGTYDVVLKDSAGVTIWGPERLEATDLADYVTEADLASTASVGLGDALVGVKSTLASAQATTQHEVNERRRSIFDFMSAAQISDVKAGSDSVDVSGALQAAFDSSERIFMPKGTYRLNSAVVSNFTPNIVGEGRMLTILKPRVTSGNALEFNNAVSSYDEGLVLEGFSIVGTGAGGATGLKVEGAVYVNSIMRDILVKSMGNHGIYIDDCLTMVMERCRAQVNGQIGILVEKSNGIGLHFCSAESNGSHGIYLNDGGVAFGENFGATLVGCHAEANGTGAISHALYIKNHYGVSVLGGWFQCESDAGAFASAAIELDGAQNCRIVGPLVTTGGTVTNLRGLGLTGAQFCDATIYAYGFASGKDVIANAGSSRNRVSGTSSVGSQGAISFTDTSSTGNAYEQWTGSGGNYGFEYLSGLHSWKLIDGTEMMRVDSAGIRLLNHTSTSSASAGGASALPATPTGYVSININGTVRKVAYY